MSKNKGKLSKNGKRYSKPSILLDKQLWGLLIPPALILVGIAFYIYKKTNSTLAVSILLLGIAVPLHVRFLDAREKDLKVNTFISLVGTLLFIFLALFNLVMPLSSIFN